MPSTNPETRTSLTQPEGKLKRLYKMVKPKRIRVSGGGSSVGTKGMKRQLTDSARGRGVRAEMGWDF